MRSLATAKPSLNDNCFGLSGAPADHERRVSAVWIDLVQFNVTLDSPREGCPTASQDLFEWPSDDAPVTPLWGSAPVRPRDRRRVPVAWPGCSACAA